jgi:hypothetical protein
MIFAAISLYLQFKYLIAIKRRYENLRHYYNDQRDMQATEGTKTDSNNLISRYEFIKQKNESYLYGTTSPQLDKKYSLN